MVNVSGENVHREVTTTLHNCTYLHTHIHWIVKAGLCGVLGVWVHVGGREVLLLCRGFSTTCKHTRNPPPIWPTIGNLRHTPPLPLPALGMSVTCALLGYYPSGPIVVSRLEKRTRLLSTPLRQCTRIRSGFQLKSYFLITLTIAFFACQFRHM